MVCPSPPCDDEDTNYFSDLKVDEDWQETLAKAMLEAGVEPDMSAVKINNWRLDELRGMGLSLNHALELAGRSDVDIHKVRATIDAGCDPATAYEIYV